jgi:hypothetical protein
MFVFHGRVPVHITLIAFMAVLSWTSSAVAQQRVLLTLAEAEDLAIAGEPGQESLLAQSEAMRELACIPRAFAHIFPHHLSIFSLF